MSNNPNPSSEQDLSDQDEPGVTCPYCYEQVAIEYIGESYDEEVHLGASYNCLECGHKFDDQDRILW